ncbi:hypothetical protein PHMEG_00033892 [Phytophthora megakarya]|uniref:Uncharacterized protein n=1 Tax=Phytophthora megakarya TaxID=4795 RepID=A0A225USD8_9STRA|nr:hypothetical protein PHMEG_00033892 [Phytophthora megakarya]
MDALLAHVSSSSSSYGSSDDEPLSLSVKRLMPPPPPPDSPPPDLTPPPPPGPPPPVETRTPSKKSTKKKSSTKKKTPVKKQLIEDFPVEEEDLDAYSDATDVFEEDVEAILFAEEEEDRRRGYTDCLTETHLDTAEYPYPAYLATMSTLFTDQNAFGKNPEDFIYCNNLLVNPSQLKLLDARTAALEQAKLEQVRKAAALKAKEEKQRRRHER